MLKRMVPELHDSKQQQRQQQQPQEHYQSNCSTITTVIETRVGLYSPHDIISVIMKSTSPSPYTTCIDINSTSSVLGVCDGQRLCMIASGVIMEFTSSSSYATCIDINPNASSAHAWRASSHISQRHAIPHGDTIDPAEKKRKDNNTTLMRQQQQQQQEEQSTTIAVTATDNTHTRPATTHATTTTKSARHDNPNNNHKQIRFYLDTRYMTIV